MLKGKYRVKGDFEYLRRIASSYYLIHGGIVLATIIGLFCLGNHVNKQADKGQIAWHNINVILSSDKPSMIALDKT